MEAILGCFQLILHTLKSFCGAHQFGSSFGSYYRCVERRSHIKLDLDSSFSPEHALLLTALNLPELFGKLFIRWALCIIPPTVRI